MRNSLYPFFRSSNIIKMYSQLFFIKSYPNNIIKSKRMFVANVFQNICSFSPNHIPCIAGPLCSISCVVFYANNKTPNPAGILFLPQIQVGIPVSGRSVSLGNCPYPSTAVRNCQPAFSSVWPLSAPLLKW